MLEHLAKKTALNEVNKCDKTLVSNAIKGTSRDGLHRVIKLG